MSGNHLYTLRPTQQRGAVLMVGLIILVVMTMIGTSAMQTVTLEEKMAGNLKDSYLAFQASEAVLRVGERDLTREDDLTPRVNRPQTLDPNFWIYQLNQVGCLGQTQSQDWWVVPACEQASWWYNDGTKRRPLPQGMEVHEVAGQPRHLIEYQMFSPDSLVQGSFGRPQTGRDFYRVTSRGEGGTRGAVVLLQSFFAWRYN